MGVKHYDVVVIGGGPGGYTAALYCARSGRSVAVLEKLSAGGQMATTDRIDNYPGFEEGIDGFELGERMERQAWRFGVSTVYGEVRSVELAGRPKRIESTEGSFEAEAVILATGAFPRELGLPDEQALRGRGVAYCTACDGMLYRGKRAAVIGLAADAPAEADFLREIGCDVQYYDGKKHRFEIRGAERADTLVVDGAAQPADVIFVLRAGFAADTLLPGIATEKGHIVVDESYAASIPGVFAAGDCTGAPYQIPAAVGEGNRAALSVVRWLRNA